MDRRGLHGLYVITNRRSAAEPWRVEQALRGGARIVQYRDKTDDPQRRLHEACRLRAMCRAAGTLFIVNDDVDLAAASGADGVHLGSSDTDLASARRALGADAIIGISCYNELERAERAATEGADYVAFGSFFPSPTKPGAVRATPELLEQARLVLDIPVAAIGGIDAGNAASLVAAGADMLAVISAVFEREDIQASARRLTDAIESAAGHGAGTSPNGTTR
ncbi:MAG: thiamine phosphate synthase [Gammaproteobacteria bacterium]|jgi:thiamine-phosphate pyrophosphorylase